MRRSEDRILTTHTGSLPRSQDLLADLVRRDRGEAVDGAALDERIRAEVAALVRRQSDAGLAVVNAGEAGKIGYATYVTERLEGEARGDGRGRAARDGHALVSPVGGDGGACAGVPAPD
jgi:5-methyltetrahydropteroyltriglutamate--homocysteine methyltransferase